MACRRAQVVRGWDETVGTMRQGEVRANSIRARARARVGARS